MGTKRTGKRKYLFLHLACLGLLPFIIFGCLYFSKKTQGRQLLEQGMDQMISQRYEASMTSNLAVLNQFPDNLADQALFQIGQLCAHPENPNRNYEKALGSFNKILDGFPESPLKPQAQIWVLFVKDVIDKERNLGILNLKNASLEKTIERQKIEISNLQKKIDERSKDDLIVSLKKKVAEQQAEIDQLLEQIEKLKRVDLRIEEKKQKIMQ